MKIMPIHLLDDFVAVDIRFIIFTEIYTKIRNDITHRIKSRIAGEIHTPFFDEYIVQFHTNIKLNKPSILASLQSSTT